MTVEKVLIKLEELCARSEQSVSDVMERMRRWGIPSADARRIADSLVERRFVDDERFARAYVRDKYRFSGWGRLKIRRGLMAKRIDSSVIDEALEAIDNREYALIAFRAILAKRRIEQIENSRDGRLRLARFAAQRGYESALIFKILDHPRLWDS